MRKTHPEADGLGVVAVERALFSGRVCGRLAPDRHRRRQASPINASSLCGYRSTVSLNRLAPVFPVRNIELAVEHYRKLGFTVRRYEGTDPYAFAERDDIELHLAQVNDLKPRRNTSAVYL